MGRSIEKKGNIHVSKKLLALLLCALLILGAVGCLEKTEKAEADPKLAAADTTGGDADTSETDALPAFTLGDFTVTVGEVRSSYNTVVEYMGYYGMAAPSTDEEIKQYRSMIIEDLLTAKVLPWKAQQRGIQLTEEKKEQVAREVEELIAEYAGDYLEEAKTELGEDAGAAQIALKAREILEQDVEDYFGYPFSQWLEELTHSYEENALTELLREDFNKGVTVTEEQARTWFEGQLADQKETFDEDFTYFKSQYDAYRSGESSVPALYTPEGFGRMQVITFNVGADDNAAYAANELEMTNLETEYGKLVLRGENEERQAEILARYQELRTQNDGMFQSILENAQKARADALNGVDMKQVYDTYADLVGVVGYHNYAGGYEIFYTKAQDADWPEQVWKAACELKENEVSELLQVGDAYYLIKRLSDLVVGTAAFEDDPAAYTAAALAEQQETEWNAVQEDWLAEARNAAVFYEENYADVGVQ
jgi:hypothetical protein